jgi:hypothetical protein
MLPRLVFGNLPGQNMRNVPAMNQNQTQNQSQNQSLQFNNRPGRIGLNLSMINRVANSRSGCSSCGK